MEAYTSLKITLKTEELATKAMAIMKTIIANRIPASPKELIKFEADICVEENFIIVEESCTLYETTFLEMIPDIMKAIATAQTASTFEAHGYYDSCNCGYVAEIEASFTNGTLNIKTIESGNEQGCCPECGEEIVDFNEYDPNKKYFCPECGEELDPYEMFDGLIPTVKEESFQIK
jgi:hypothetical protein